MLQYIYRDLRGRMALNCRVIEPGRVEVGDAIELLARYPDAVYPTLG